MPIGCTEFASVTRGMNFNYNPAVRCSSAEPVVFIHNQLAVPATVQWDTGFADTLQPGFNRLPIPNYNQRERARIGITKCTPRCRLYIGPANLLEMGRNYILVENQQGQPCVTMAQ